jgi:hypothetical protein
MQDKKPEEISEIEKSIITVLANEMLSQRDCEKKLFALLTHKKFSLVRILLKDRFVILYGTMLA